MGLARLQLRYHPTHRMFSALGGLGLLVTALVGAVWSVGLALTAGSIALAPVLIGLMVGAHRGGLVGSRMVTTAAARPELIMDATRIVIEDPTTLIGRQSIPFDLVDSIYVGPDVGSWLVANYGAGPSMRQMQLGRYPQFPNMVIVFKQPIIMNQARSRMVRLWHLTKPPNPREPIHLLWATVNDHDSAYLIFHDRGLDPEWATASAGLAPE